MARVSVSGRSVCCVERKRVHPSPSCLGSRDRFVTPQRRGRRHCRATWRESLGRPTNSCALDCCGSKTGGPRCNHHTRWCCHSDYPLGCLRGTSSTVLFLPSGHFQQGGFSQSLRHWIRKRDCSPQIPRCCSAQGFERENFKCQFNAARFRESARAWDCSKAMARPT